MKQLTLSLILAISISPLVAQQEKQLIDSADLLQEVVVRGYENNRKLAEIPASVSIINNYQLNRFSNTNLLPAVNANPGMRMEERSPGSYRLNIRGSSLRSPFGIRNVKVYYNDIPYTDPGGNTYLNQLGYYNVQSMEIIKGPGSSIYGAGTGGVVLINSDPAQFKRGISADFAIGSFNSRTYHAGLRGGNQEFHHSVNFQAQQSDGYRDHTQMDRKVFTWDASAKVGAKGILKAHFLHGDLYYQTPGALTAAEYANNPKAARPRVGQTPGSEEAKAAINQKMYLAGFSYQLKWNEHWQNTTSLYGAYSRVINPTTRNYERRIEPHFGSRNVIQYQNKIGRSLLTLQGGAEVQEELAIVRVYSNKQGFADTLQTDDELDNKQFILFTQASLDLPGNWLITGGLSLNQLKVNVKRLSHPQSEQGRKYHNEFAPRIAILKKIRPAISVYGSIAKGFSPPSNGELLPSTGVISTNLEAEKGYNFEAGARGSLLQGRFYFDINTFYFQLKNTIAQRRDFSGGDYFVNSGSARQNGLETFASYRLLNDNSRFFNSIKIWASHTWNNFRYKDYQKVTDDTLVYSGNKLPSTAPHYVSAGLDVNSKSGLYANITYYYCDPIPLNDENTNFASSYNLTGARIGFRKSWINKYDLDIFGVVDNIFNVKYSLGNDINAFGGRYYNAAPGLNFALGASIRFAY